MKDIYLGVPVVLGRKNENVWKRYWIGFECWRKSIIRRSAVVLKSVMMVFDKLEIFVINFQ